MLLGLILDPKMAPKSLSRTSKIRSKTNWKFMQLGLAFYIDFESNLAPTWPQLGAKLGPKIVWKSILRGSKIGLKFQDSKMTPKSIPTDPKWRPNDQNRQQKWCDFMLDSYCPELRQNASNVQNLSGLSLRRIRLQWVQAGRQAGKQAGRQAAGRQQACK